MSNENQSTLEQPQTSEPRPSASHVVSPCVDYIWDLQPFDIVCGRGAPCQFNEGNYEFMDLITRYQTSYLCARRSDKPRIALQVLQEIHDRGGRFVRRQKAPGRQAWVEVNEKSAYEKVCQALRDGAPELRRQMLAASQRKKQKQQEEGKALSLTGNW